MFREQRQEYVEVSREIFKVMASDITTAVACGDLQEAIIESLLETESQVSDLIKELLSVEEEVAQTLLETEETKQKSSSKLRKIEQELQAVRDKNGSLESSIKFLQKELEEVKLLEDEITEVEREAQEDTTVVIPSALRGSRWDQELNSVPSLPPFTPSPGMLPTLLVPMSTSCQLALALGYERRRYMAKLFHSVTKIDWDYNCDSTLIKGIHYGGEIAQPISIDSTQHSKIFICDYLWSLLSTEW